MHKKSLKDFKNIQSKLNDKIQTLNNQINTQQRILNELFNDSNNENNNPQNSKFFSIEDLNLLDIIRRYNQTRFPCHQQTPGTQTQAQHRIPHTSGSDNTRINSQQTTNNSYISDNNKNFHTNSTASNNSQTYGMYSSNKAEHKSNANNIDYLTNTNRTGTTASNINYTHSNSRQRPKVEFVDLTNDDQFYYSDDDTHAQASHTPIFYDSYEDYGFRTRSVRVAQDGQNLRISPIKHASKTILTHFVKYAAKPRATNVKGVRNATTLELQPY